MNDKKFKLLGIILMVVLPLAYLFSQLLRDSISSIVFNTVYFADLVLGLIFLLPYAIKRIKRMTLIEWLIILFLIVFYGILIYNNTIFKL